MPCYPATILLSARSLNRLAALIRTHRQQRQSRWRRHVDPGRRALLVLADLRNGDTLARLAAGFEIGVTTAWRYVREAVDRPEAVLLRKAKRHGVNIQVIADALGRLVWAWAALPGSTHGLSAARTHSIVDAPTRGVGKNRDTKGPNS